VAMAPLVFDATSFYGDMVPVTAGDLPAFLTQINGRMVVAFLDGADESAAYTPATQMPDEYAAGTLTAHLCFFSTATTGEHDLEVSVEAVTSGDSTDLDAATSFDTANQVFLTVAGTAGFMLVGAVTLTNKDSVAAGDSVRFLVRRDSDETVGGTGNNGDDAAGTFYLLWMAVVES
jgi:hypothetical protein